MGRPLMNRTSPSRPRLLVSRVGFQAGTPFQVDVVRPLFPAEDLTDTSLDANRAAWSTGVLGGFTYAATTLGGITSRFGKWTSFGRVYLGSVNKPARVVPGDTYRSGVNGYRESGTNELRLGVRWTFADGTTSDQRLATITAAGSPAATWVGQPVQVTVPADAVGASPYVESAAGWYIDLGEGNTELASRTVSDVGTITIRRGRESAESLAPPATMSTTLPVSGAYPVSTGDLVRVEVWPESLGAPGYADRPIRFVGQVVDPKLRVQSATPGELNLAQVVASSPSARLARVEIGDTPWPAETSDNRADRILQLAADQDPHLAVFSSLDAGPTVVARDVDRQAAVNLLDELADSTGGNVRELRDGQLYWAPFELSYPRSIVNGPRGSRATLVLPAYAYSLPLDLEQAAATNSVAVYYGTANPQAYVQVRDAQAVLDRGLHHVKLNTQLAYQADAQALAQRILALGARPAWQLSSVVVDLLDLLERDSGLADQLLGLEAGDAVFLDGLPTSLPELPGDATFSVEGWTETITASSWRLELNLVDITRVSEPATYGDWAEVMFRTAYADAPAQLTYQAAGAWEPR